MADHFIEKKIYYHDTDAGGVVYYANYLKHLEEGRFEFCLSKGISMVESAKEGVIFPVVLPWGTIFRRQSGPFMGPEKIFRSFVSREMGASK